MSDPTRTDVPTEPSAQPKPVPASPNQEVPRNVNKISKEKVFFSLLILFILLFTGYFIFEYIQSNKSKIAEMELVKKALEKEIEDKEKKISVVIEESRKIQNESLSGGKEAVKNTLPQSTTPNASAPNSHNPQLVAMPGQLSTEPSGGMIVYINGGNMNVSEVNLGNGAKMSFSGLRWTGSIPNLITNMVSSETVGSVTEHKIPPFEDIVFEKTQETLASVWVSGRTYHDFLVAYNVGTTNSPVWVEPTSSEKVASIRIKSLGPELTVKFTVKKKP